MQGSTPQTDPTSLPVPHRSVTDLPFILPVFFPFITGGFVYMTAQVLLRNSDNFFTATPRPVQMWAQDMFVYKSPEQIKPTEKHSVLKIVSDISSSCY